MAFFSITKGEYDNTDCVEKVINYICNPFKTPSGFIGGLSVITTSIEDIIMQFNAVKKIYHNESGKQVRHFFVSFSGYRDWDYHRLYAMAIWIAGYYSDEYQIVFAIHEDTYHPHIHFVMNTVNFNTGKKFSRGKSDYYQFRDHVDFFTNLSYLSR